MPLASLMFAGIAGFIPLFAAFAGYMEIKRQERSDAVKFWSNRLFFVPIAAVVLFGVPLAVSFAERLWIEQQLALVSSEDDEQVALGLNSLAGSIHCGAPCYVHTCQSLRIIPPKSEKAAASFQTILFRYGFPEGMRPTLCARRLCTAAGFDRNNPDAPYDKALLETYLGANYLRVCNPVSD